MFNVSCGTVSVAGDSAVGAVCAGHRVAENVAVAKNLRILS